MNRRMMTALALSAAVLVVFAGSAVDLSAVASAKAEARQPADVAAKLSGNWVLNRELSTGFGSPAPGRGRGGNAQARPLYAMASPAQGRRGGGGGGDQTDLTPEQRAEQAAMRQVQQIADRMNIKASADSVTFVDSRGERTFAINDKSSTIDVGGSPVKVKTKWDKRVLRQEFTNAQARLVQTCALDDSGHMVLTAKVESMTLTLGAGADRPTALVTPDQTAIFDRQQRERAPRASHAIGARRRSAERERVSGSPWGEAPRIRLD